MDSSTGRAVGSNAQAALDVAVHGQPTAGSRTFAAKVVSVFSRPITRAVVSICWLGLTACGVACIKSFIAELDTNVPPVPGSLSDDARQAMGRYFPDTPISGAMLCESAGESRPFIRFENRSTCVLEAKREGSILGGDLSVTFSCSSASAAGHGCMVRHDLGPQLLNKTEELLQGMGLPALVVQRLVRNMSEMLPALEQRLPNALCPVAVDQALTRDWLDFGSRLQATLREKVPQCEATVQSFHSVPSLPLSRVIDIPLAGTSIPLNVTAVIPAGALWSTLQSQLLSGSGTSSLMAVITKTCDGKSIENPMGKEAKDISDAMQEAAGNAPTSFRARASSQVLMLVAIQSGIETTMSLSTKTLPVALLILAGMVGNLRLLICTLLNLIATIASSILIMYPIAKVLTVSTTAPSLMIAVSLAMSIDYSLFLLSRFQKEVHDKRSAPEAVRVMLATSGKIVLISGMTLLLCFLTMQVLPVAFIATLGLSAAVTVLMAVAAALTLTPVMLLSCPTFFSSNRHWGLSLDGCCCRCRRRAGAAAREVDPSGPRVPMERQLTPEQVENLQEAQLDMQMKGSCWPGFGRLLQRLAVPILIVLLAVGIPVAAMSLPKFSQSAGLVPFMPTDAAITRTLTDLQDEFGVGSLFPTTLLLVPPKGATATETARDAWLQKSCEALKAIADAANTDPHAPPFTAKAFTGKMILNGACTTQGLGTWSDAQGPYSATLVQITYQMDPFSAAGQRWITRMRDAVATQGEVGEWYIGGEGPNQMDAAAITFAKFPMMIALMMAVVLVLIGFSFGSVVAPLRAVICLSWMMAVTFGLAVFVFQDGWLDFLNWPQLGPRPTGAMSWMSPCISCSVVVGLGLDYDIFYSERVLEECEHGRGEREAAVRALTATANTISAAGVIMVVAFLSLLMSSTPTLNEIAFLLVVGVLIDCFVTTKIIIPSVISLLGRFNFWPRKFQVARGHESMRAGLVEVVNP